MEKVLLFQSMEVVHSENLSVLQDILKDAIELNIQSAAEMPYFEGDFWPNVLEESIKELDQEEEEKRKREAAEAAAAEEADLTTEVVEGPEVSFHQRGTDRWADIAFRSSAQGNVFVLMPSFSKKIRFFIALRIRLLFTVSLITRFACFVVIRAKERRKDKKVAATRRPARVRCRRRTARSPTCLTVEAT